MHADPALRERQRDSPGADPELERCTAPGETREEVDRRADDRRVEHDRIVVVPGGDPLAEVVLRHSSSFR